MNNIEIDVKEKHLIHYESHGLEIGKEVTIPATLGIVYDVEPGPKQDEWLLYIDIQYKQETMLHIESRTSFSMSTALENLWVPGVAEAYLKVALKNTKQGLFQNLPEDFKDSAVYNSIDSDNNVKLVYDLLIADVNKSGIYSSEDPGIYKGKITLQPGKDYNIMCSLTLCVFDEIFYLSPHFNKEKNIKTFGQYLPLRYYLTVKLKLMRLMKNETIQLNIKQLIMFLFMVRCSCSLLLTEHFESLWPGLEAKGATQQGIDEYIRISSKFLKDIDASLQQANANIVNLKDDIDWVELVS